MEATEFFGFFGLGLISSLHCLGMCGPIALAQSSRLASLEKPASARRATLAHLLYNLGRVTTYSFVGGACGAMGKSLDLSLMALGVGASHRVVGVLAGVAIILFGLTQLGLLRRWRFLSENVAFASAFFEKFVGRLVAMPSLWAKFAMGLALGFLPCALTYSMFVVAIASGGFLNGVLTLSAFGMGTIPALFLTGVFSGAFLRSLRAYGNAISASASLLLGAFVLLSSLLGATH